MLQSPLEHSGWFLAGAEVRYSLLRFPMLVSACSVFAGVRPDGIDHGLCDWPYFGLPFEPGRVGRTLGGRTLPGQPVAALYHRPGSRRLDRATFQTAQGAGRGPQRSVRAYETGTHR